MAHQKLLVSWVGNNDLNGWAEADKEAARLLQQHGFEAKTLKGGGPLKSAAESGHFDVFHLLSRMPEEIDLKFAKWLGVKVVRHSVKVDNPTDYGAVYHAADRVLQGVHRIADGHELNLFLSPGTPTMAAVWVLLGKTLYPATLWQAYEGKLSAADLPFDLALFERRASQQLDVAFLKAADSLPASFDPIIGTSAAIKDVRYRAAVVARHDVCVLLLGESGTGKDLFAKAIHQASGRKDGPYHAVNCAAIPGQLLESQLFGHKKGAFTGADRNHKGLFEQADKGTLFLDEVGECDPAMQAKLLRILQPPAEEPCLRVFSPLGSEREVRSNVRIIAATNRDLLDMVSKGTFREDLYYRLASVTIRLPPLRERQSDVPGIATKLLQQIGHALKTKVGKDAMRLSPDAIRFAQTRRWKGNIRQLYNVLLQAAMFATGEEISRRELEAAAIDVGEAPEPTGGFPFGGEKAVTEHLEDLRRRLFREALRRSRDNQSEAAKLLGISPAAVSKFVRQQETASD